MPTQPDPIFNEETLRHAIHGQWGAYGAHAEVYDVAVKLAHEAQDFRELLHEVASSGVEFADYRMRYLTVQIDHETWKRIQVLKANGDLDPPGHLVEQDIDT